MQHTKMKITLAIIFFLTGFIQVADAQNRFQHYEWNTNDIYRIVLFDGNEFVGNYIDHNDNAVSIKTNSIPKVDIPFDKIKNIDVVPKSNMKDGTYWFKNPNPTRYLFTPSAFNLDQGEGYYQNTYIIINSVAYGITDFLSVGAGFELISLFAGEGGPIFFVNVKGGGEIAKNFHLGANVLYVNIPTVFDQDEERNGAFVGGALATYGSLDHNITAGVGYALAQGELSNNPVFNLSGMTRLGKRFALVSENWIFPETAIFSYGVRFFGEKISVDLAFLNNADIAEEIVIGIPYVDFVVKF